MSKLSVSHCDLDGIGAQIVIRQFRGDIQRMNLGYDKIDEYIDIIDEYCLHSKPQEVWITDLSFSLIQLEKLFRVVKRHLSIKFFYIDHHPFLEDYSHINANNLILIINQKASATKLTYLFLKNSKKLLDPSKSEELEKYVEYTNTYDLWITESNLFKGAMVYNELFWEFKKDHYFSRFKDNFKLRNSDKEKFISLMEKKKKLFNKLDKSGRIFRHEPNAEKRIFMMFIDDYRNHIPLDYPGFDVYILIASYGGVSMRLRKKLSDDGKLKDAVVKRILQHDNVETGGGHPQAFGTLLLDASAHEQVKFGQFLLKVFDEELDNLQK